MSLFKGVKSHLILLAYFHFDIYQNYFKKLTLTIQEQFVNQFLFKKNNYFCHFKISIISFVVFNMLLVFHQTLPKKNVLLKKSQVSFNIVCLLSFQHLPKLF
jgi:hypothetical protein